MFKLVVLSVLVAAAAAEPSVVSAWGLGLNPLGLGWGGVASPLIAPVATAPLIAAPNYRGPLSLAPGQPANILAADGRPLDTLSVNLDRAAHLTARAVDHAGVHLLKKRSVLAAPLIAPAAPLIAPAIARIGVPGAWGIAPTPLVSAAPLGLGVGAWNAGVWGHGAPLGRIW